jgi:hypothetical protein
VALRPDFVMSWPPLKGLRDHTRWKTTLCRTPCGRAISPTQRPLPDSTQHSQQTDIHVTAVFEPAVPVSERPQTHALDRAANGENRLLRYV